MIASGLHRTRNGTSELRRRRSVVAFLVALVGGLAGGDTSRAQDGTSRLACIILSTDKVETANKTIGRVIFNATMTEANFCSGEGEKERCSLQRLLTQQSQPHVYHFSFVDREGAIQMQGTLDTTKEERAYQTTLYRNGRVHRRFVHSAICEEVSVDDLQNVPDRGNRPAPRRIVSSPDGKIRLDEERRLFCNSHGTCGLGRVMQRNEAAVNLIEVRIEGRIPPDDGAQVRPEDSVKIYAICHRRYPLIAISKERGKSLRFYAPKFLGGGEVENYYFLACHMIDGSNATAVEKVRADHGYRQSPTLQEISTFYDIHKEDFDDHRDTLAESYVSLKILNGYQKLKTLPER